MWLFTPRGFFTVAAVTGANLEDVVVPIECAKVPSVMVRARVKTDLEGLESLWNELFPGQAFPTVQTLAHDYPYRMVMPRSSWATLVARMAEEITYRKFKDAVCEAQGHQRYSLYVEVWGVLYGAEQKLANWLKRKASPLPLAREAQLSVLRDPGYDDWLDEDYRKAVVHDPPRTSTGGKTFINTGTGLKEVKDNGSALVAKKRGR